MIDSKWMEDRIGIEISFDTYKVAAMSILC